MRNPRRCWPRFARWRKARPISIRLLAGTFLQTPAAPGDLTPREVEVLRQLALGLANKEIAHALSISEETVKSHVGNVFGKLQVENRSQAIVQALKRRLVKLEELS